MGFRHICVRLALMLAPSHLSLNYTMFLPSAGDQAIRIAATQEYLQRSFSNGLLFCAVGAPCYNQTTTELRSEIPL